MRFNSKIIAIFAPLLAARQAAANGIYCKNFIQNGGFETGDFSYWTLDESGACQHAINDGSFDPPGDGTPMPPLRGLYDAITHQTGPGHCVLSQEASPIPTAGTITSATLSWKDRVRNYGGGFFEGSNWNQALPEQEARVRVCVEGGNGFGLVEVWSTNPGDALIQMGPNIRSADVTPLIQGIVNFGGDVATIHLEEEDNQNFFNMNWDYVVLEVCADYEFPGSRPKDNGIYGDPHFLSWTHEWFDYMGQCDLVLVDSPTFGGGLGFTAHVRAKTRYDYSYIETAAIKIGDDTLEISSHGASALNGVSDPEFPLIVGGYQVTHHEKSLIEHVFKITLDGADQFVEIQTYKDMVSIKFDDIVEEDFVHSTGLMGNWHTGAHLARDGLTVMTNNDEFGQEWQVREDEPMLFMAAPEAGECKLPKISATDGRRLGEKGVSKVEAEVACAHVMMGREQCIYDVMVTGDIGAASGGAY